ncbi:MAG: putative universal stress protein [Labilithrix sp.]|jgi:nucleotide-binding universal stress UspA family protein|nr:putative universal stress protein [Labilithrix sp.]
MYPFRKIMVGTDFASTSSGALDLATGLAYEYEAELVIAHAIEILVPAYPIALMPEVTEIERNAKQALDSIVERVLAVWPRVTPKLLWGNPATAVVRYAEDEHVDLLVVGTHGRHGASRWLLGSVAEKVTRTAHVPVLTVHPDEGARETAPAPT